MIVTVPSKFTPMGYDDEEVKATVIGMDPKVDIAVIEFKYSKHIMPIKGLLRLIVRPSKQKKRLFGIAISRDGYILVLPPLELVPQLL